MLDDAGGQGLDDVIELSDEEEGTARAPAPGAPGATMVSAARQAPQHRPSPAVEIVGGSPVETPLPTPLAVEHDLEAEEAIVASERQIAELRDALSHREQELHVLRDELLERERELTLLRSLRPPPPSRRLVDAGSVAPSSAGSARARFLGEALERTLDEGWRNAVDFVRHFPPSSVMKRLDRHPAVRATYLRLLVGIPERTALRTPTDDAGRLLQSAVDAGDTDAESYVNLFHRTATSNYLDPATIWSFMIDAELLEVAWQPAAARHGVAQRHVARLLDVGLAHAMIEPMAAVEGISVEIIAETLPTERWVALLRRMLEQGRDGRPFVDADLLASVPSRVLVEHMPLPYVLEGVLIPMSRAVGLVTSLPPAG